MKYVIYLSILCLCALIGCTTSRESIVASVNSVLGISVAQNQQTQMYEAKAGYLRSQFYLIPTDKIVENSGNPPLQKVQGGADKAPQVVSAVNTESSINQLILGFKSKELFAVGADAVNSKAAIAMFVGNAESDASAQAASAAAQFGTVSGHTPALPGSAKSARSSASSTPALTSR